MSSLKYGCRCRNMNFVERLGDTLVGHLETEVLAAGRQLGPDLVGMLRIGRHHRVERIADRADQDAAVGVGEQFLQVGRRCTCIRADDLQLRGVRRGEFGRRRRRTATCE